VEHLTDRPEGVLAGQRVTAPDGAETTIDAGKRLSPGLQMKVGAACLDDVAKRGLEVEHTPWIGR
jgi:hypothetical protein